MHPCLELEEIVSLICAHLEVAHRPELARLARVSHNFTDPALNSLWKEQSSLVPLLKTMPTDLWEFIGLDDTDDELDDDDTSLSELSLLKPRRLLIANDWNPRFEYYASKIKLYEPYDTTIHLHPDVFKIFISYIPFRPLLPNIKSLTFSSEQPFSRKHLPFFPVLIGPQVEEITLDLIARQLRPVDSAMLLASVTIHCPNLKRLLICGDSNKGHESTLCGSLQILTALQELHFEEGSISSEVFNQVSRLPDLQRLYLDIISNDMDDSTSNLRFPKRGTNPFPKLRDLTLRTPNWAFGASLMKDMNCPFRELAILDEGYPYRQTHGDTFTLLTKAINENSRLISSLRILDIHGTTYLPPDESFTGDRLTRALDNLLQLRSVEELTLIVSGVQLLTDSWLQKASKHWPNIQRFIMYGDVDHPPKFTFSGFIPLIQGWRYLAHFEVAAIWEPFSVPEGISSTAITRIKPGRGSRLPDNGDTLDVPGMLRSLLALFPRLEGIDLEDAAHLRSEKWQEISAIVKENLKRQLMDSDGMVLD